MVEISSSSSCLGNSQESGHVSMHGNSHWSQTHVVLLLRQFLDDSSCLDLAPGLRKHGNASRSYFSSKLSCPCHFRSACCHLHPPRWGHVGRRSAQGAWKLQGCTSGQGVILSEVFPVSCEYLSNFWSGNLPRSLVVKNSRHVWVWARKRYLDRSCWTWRAWRCPVHVQNDCLVEKLNALSFESSI